MFYLTTLSNKLFISACPWVVQFITCGRHNDYNYMVMELLGENISELRRKQPGGKFSLLTTCKLGIQMLRAIEAVHDLGYLHRDIKPVQCPPNNHPLPPNASPQPHHTLHTTHCREGS